jgi:hypothetical protein
MLLPRRQFAQHAVALARDLHRNLLRHCS